MARGCGGGGRLPVARLGAVRLGPNHGGRDGDRGTLREVGHRACAPVARGSYGAGHKDQGLRLLNGSDSGYNKVSACGWAR